MTVEVTKDSLKFKPDKNDDVKDFCLGLCLQRVHEDTLIEINDLILSLPENKRLISEITIREFADTADITNEFSLENIIKEIEYILNEYNLKDKIKSHKKGPNTSPKEILSYGYGLNLGIRNFRKFNKVLENNMKMFLPNLAIMYFNILSENTGLITINNKSFEFGTLTELINNHINIKRSNDDELIFEYNENERELIIPALDWNRITSQAMLRLINLENLTTDKRYLTTFYKLYYNLFKTEKDLRLAEELGLQRIYGKLIDIGKIYEMRRRLEMYSDNYVDEKLYNIYLLVQRDIRSLASIL